MKYKQEERVTSFADPVAETGDRSISGSVVVVCVHANHDVFYLKVSRQMLPNQIWTLAL